jgi:hypothetical protein
MAAARIWDCTARSASGGEGHTVLHAHHDVEPLRVVIERRAGEPRRQAVGHREIEHASDFDAEE